MTLHVEGILLAEYNLQPHQRNLVLRKCQIQPSQERLPRMDALLHGMATSMVE
jgi:hypothetical protein